jgi:hypothetical protein
MPGCIKVKPKQTTTCDACSYPDFYLTSDLACACYQGELAGELCSSVIGCSGAII